jgi:ABC-type Fe3+/spermidine/putrescine transport system ATPase subunit
MMHNNLLEVKHVVKSYNGIPALRGVSLQVRAGAIVALLGPSGCGKTTLLRVIAGLEPADHGEVHYAGRRIDAIPTHQRGFGLMFQDYALFPHRNVAENVAFGLRMRKLPRAAIEARVADMLTLVGLAGYDRRYVYELSGGERQRVALARCLAPGPGLLMLDEPLGALDRTLRERLLDELHAILNRVGVTSLYVTHDQSEAFAIAGWLVLLNAGQIEQQGPPQEIYRRPATRFAAQFLGFNNLIRGFVRSNTGPGSLLIETAVGWLRPEQECPDTQPGDRVTVVVRPEAAVIVLAGGDQPVNRVGGVILERVFRGSRSRLVVRQPGGQELEFELDSQELPAPGDHVALMLHPAAMSVIRETADP